MLRYVNYNIVFQEIPGEVTLAVNLSNCPNRCKGCHSQYLQEDIGEPLNEQALNEMLDKYGNSVTCLCFMGGDSCPEEVERLASFLHDRTKGRIKTGWYSGKTNFPANCSVKHFNYIKLGPYIESKGGLDHPTTNQRFYQITEGDMVDMTHLFQIKKTPVGY
ncbi:anaerobic ribonucleoside-triphosphate reductase activating protein [Porphyromonadaceae bacterium OttesenSCG-928-L07]|nr:anaerobic ribonucleoside-triphosphate reductase activating protein [Porphyromonadaceae bacterium OttesenSCG-928-L07]MDL2251457.1 anaerobic ribonucleoside-triphosphate reductase activating protein [Odoribacter sp. OttesenSCG-928-J03]MDL2282954.1 anaerobic ribonucleoside-triphosphate reductase activating protein [Odoribacter sp. OttesenSCG-928-G04]